MKTTDRVAGASTSQKVEAFIRRAIYEGRLKPRERLIEDDIARHVGCSRGPVREAVLRLERDGMIVITPRRGTFIRDISPDDVEVVFSTRGKLEGLCVRYMRESFTPEKEAALLRCLQAMQASTVARDDEGFLQADMRLHRTIWKLSGKQPLYRTLCFVMNPLFFMVARTYSPKVGAIEESYANHEEYVNSIQTLPIPKLERYVEKYFAELYADINRTVFQRAAPSLHLFEESLEDGEFAPSEEVLELRPAP